MVWLQPPCADPAALAPSHRPGIDELRGYEAAGLGPRTRLITAVRLYAADDTTPAVIEGYIAAWRRKAEAWAGL